MPYVCRDEIFPHVECGIQDWVGIEPFQKRKEQVKKLIKNGVARGQLEITQGGRLGS